jgi:FkbH-like protein
LDLDNTLWGGVIGDDGLHGVVLGQGSPVGEAYLAIQKTALMLRDRGIILAVSSKNDDETARKMFREHPEMLLRENHIAVFQANWQDKASNLCAIAESLNIGIDSLVLLDDNPAERQQVRLALPQVAVPELPEHPDLFSEILLSAGYFETTQFTLDDRQRANHYTANTARRAVLGVGTDLEDYLKSLEMEAHVSPFDEVGRSRITQLINKTNQFNLTTQRYTYSDVAQFESDPSIVDLQIRLKDRYGDNGMICVVICKVSNQDLIIDTWLMSCRVLNRRVEDMILNLLIGIAKKRKLVRIIGTYYPTDRNRIVSDLYSRLGFQNQIELSDLAEWHFTVSEHTVSNVPIKIRLSENIEIDKTAAGMDR